MQVITFLNGKGGVGKSTLAVHTAAGLAMAGFRTVIIDADMQANATTALGAPMRGHFYNLCVRPAETAWADVLTPVDAARYSPAGSADGGLYVVASNAETRNIASSTEDDAIIARRLAELDGHVDYVVFDTSPQADLLHSQIYLASDWLFVPTQLERDSALEGVPKSLERAHRIRRRAQERGVTICQLGGILPNMRQNTVLHNSVLEELREQYGGLVWEPISRRIAVAEANLASETVFAHAPGSASDEELRGMVARVLATVEAVNHA